MPTEPPLALTSPRTRAAMKVLGIHPQDISVPKERHVFDDGVGGDVRHQAWETKRRQLMHSVHGMATDKSLDLLKSHSESALNQPSEGTNLFLAEVQAKEAKNIEKMRKRAKEDIQKVVIEEMEAKKKVEIRNAKLEEHRKRVVELNKKQKEELEVRRKEAEKKLAKTVQVREQADKKLKEKCENLQEELRQKAERVEGVLQAREAGWEENRVVKQQARDQNYARIAIFKCSYMKDAEDAYAKCKLKTSASEGRLADIRQKMWDQQAAKTYRTDEVMAGARSQMLAAQAKKDAAYLEKQDVHAKAKEVREAAAKERQKAYAKANEDAKKAFEKSFKVAKDEEAQKLSYVSPRMIKTMSGDFSQTPAWRTDASMKAFETHKTMGELRQLNLQLLRRAHKHHQDQALHKIQDMRERVRQFQGLKDDAQSRRYDMMKNVAIEKHKLSFQVERVRDAPPEKMNGLLEQMGLPPIKSGKEEGEEEEKK